MAFHTLTRTSMSCHNNLFPALLLAFLFLSTLVHTASASNSTTKPTTNSLKTYQAFIKNECNSTTYPKVCYKALYPYASTIKTNPLTLTKVSVSLALKAARSTSSTLTKLSKLNGLTHAETEVLGDCKENIGDTVELLVQSYDALQHLKGTSSPDDRFQWDNIKTWMSAAITDESTCTGEFDEMQVRPSLRKVIKTNVANVDMLNSDALYLVNRLNY